MSYLADVGALARKDLLLELRARETLPAMALFVISALVVFNFALPTGSSDLAAKGLLWVAIVFTALLGLGRAFVPEREQGVMDGLVLAPCDRSAIWLGKGIAVLGFLALVEVIALPAFAVFFSGVSGRTRARARPDGRGRCADRVLRAGGRRPGALAEDLLLPRPDRPDRLRLLRLGRVEGAASPLEAAARRRPRELRRHPPGRDLRRADADHRLDLGQDLVGRLVGLELEPARAPPGLVPL